MNKKLRKGLTVSSAAAMGMSIVLPTVSVIAAPAVANGWVNQNGTWYYYNNGTLVKNGWAKDSKGWCFLSAVDGSWVQEGWAKDSTGWGYIRAGYWVQNATWAKDATGWQFIGANGYWVQTVAAKATNPIADATAAVVKAEGSKLQADVDAAKALVNALDAAIPEKAALTTRLNAVVSVFEVGSVSVVDATHIKVTFTQAVDAETAEDVDNYTFEGVGIDDIAVGEANLQDDGVSVILTLDGTDKLSNDSGDKYTVTIADVENAAGKAIPDYEEIVTLYDSVKPTVESVKVNADNTVTVKFSEKVVNANETNITVTDEDGYDVEVTVTADADDDDELTYDITGLTDTGDYKLSIENVKDLAGNKMAAYSKDFSLEEDNTDPDVKSISVVSADTFKVTFSEEVNDSFNVYVNGVEDLAASIDPVNDDNEAFYVTVGAVVSTDALTKIKIDGYTDLADNEGDSYTKYITFGDKTPDLSSTTGTIKTFGGTKYAVFTFNQNIDNFTFADLDATYVDTDGVESTVTLAAGDFLTSADLDDLDDNQFAIDVDALDNGDYDITLPAGFADAFGVDSDEIDASFSVTTADEAKVEVSDFTTDGDYYYVTFDGKVGASALDVDNYELDGDNVFSKAVFTSTAKNEVKLTVADGAIKTTDTTDEYYRFTTNNITDADGDDVADFDSYEDGPYAVEFLETVKPYVTKVVAVDADTVTVTFNEDLANDGAITTADFDIFVDGHAVDIDAIASVSGDGKTYTLTIASYDAIDNEASVVKAGTSSDFDGEDAAGNAGVTESYRSDTL